MAHVTGGALIEKSSAWCPKPLGLEIDTSSWPLPPVFDWLQREGNVPREEMWRTFNCGVGFVLMVAPGDVAAINADLDRLGLAHWQIGQVAPAAAANACGSAERTMLSDRGAGVRAAAATCRPSIDAIARGRLDARDRRRVLRQGRAPGAGTRPPRRAFPRSGAVAAQLSPRARAFDEALFSRVDGVQPDLIVCAGYMRLLQRLAPSHARRGRMINIHPSLLPAFKGLRTHQQALDAGVGDARRQRAFRHAGAGWRPGDRAGARAGAGGRRCADRWPRACCSASIRCWSRRCVRCAAGRIALIERQVCSTAIRWPHRCSWTTPTTSARTGIETRSHDVDPRDDSVLPASLLAGLSDAQTRHRLPCSAARRRHWNPSSPTTRCSRAARCSAMPRCRWSGTTPGAGASTWASMAPAA